MNSEEEGYKHRALGHTVGDWGRGGPGTSNGAKLSDKTKTKRVLNQTGQGLGDCIQGSRTIKEDEETNVVRVSSNEEVIYDFDESSLSAIFFFSETRSKGFIEVVIVHVFLDLFSHCSFQYFAQEWKIGYWMKVVVSHLLSHKL